MTDTAPEVITPCPQAADATNAPLGLHPAAHAQLHAAAGTMSQAWPAWSLPHPTLVHLQYRPAPTVWLK